MNLSLSTVLDFACVSCLVRPYMHNHIWLPKAHLKKALQRRLVIDLPSGGRVGYGRRHWGAISSSMRSHPPTHLPGRWAKRSHEKLNTSKNADFLLDCKLESFFGDKPVYKNSITYNTDQVSKTETFSWSLNPSKLIVGICDCFHLKEQAPTIIFATLRRYLQYLPLERCITSKNWKGCAKSIFSIVE